MIIDIVLVYAAGRGGLEDVIATVSSELTKKGHRVRFFQSYPSQNPDWEQSLPEYYYYGEMGNFESETIPTLSKGYANKLKEAGKPDIVLATHAPSLSFICRSAIASVKGKMAPVLSWLHGPPEYYGNETMLRYSEGHLAISSQIGDSISKSIFEGQPIYNVGNPVIRNEFKTIKRSEGKKLELLYVGRLDQHQKRLDILFKGLELLETDWRLHCIGEGPDGEKIRKLADELGIKDRILFHGWQEDPWNVAEEVTALVMSSDYEGLPLVLMEALGRGMPVISTNCSGASDIINDGENGWIYPIGDFRALADILQKIVENQSILPSVETCKASVQKFHYLRVVENIELILQYHQKLFLQQSNNRVSHIIKDNSYWKSQVVNNILDSVINGVEYLGTTRETVVQEKLAGYFSQDFLELLQQDDQVEGNTEKVTAYVCYPKVDLIDYSFMKAKVSFLLVNEIYNGNISVKEKLHYSARLYNDNGNWKISDLILADDYPSESLPKKERKQKVLLVTTANSSSSNTAALYKNMPKHILDSFEVEIAEQRLADEYYQKVLAADILVLTEANVIFDKEQYTLNQTVIDLWHGFPLKAMGHADKNEADRNAVTERWSNIDYVCSYSDKFSEMMTKCFKVDPEIFHITGMPRNDLLIKSYHEKDNSILRKLFHIETEGKKFIMFMPTYRKVTFNNRQDTTLNRSHFFGFEKFNSEEFTAFLEKNNLELIVKFHPVEEQYMLKNGIELGNHVHLLTHEMLTQNNLDMYDILGKFDLLLTDYSSVYFDYLLIDKPIIFLPIDVEQYKTTRGFILGDYDMWTPGAKATTQQQLQDEVLTNLKDSEKFAAERAKVRNIVHYYQDDVSSFRVWEFIKQRAISIN
ncbi:CDP-glycerol glycerophosphotransferase family protein [Niallia sp. SS-2023]|uniref:CDP-glycerol glycerophosphotransferase family protein n=1 Tax=Niallia sp. SS-2023 TaxID=3051155 RepID=UPI0025518297|nr:CDP-glycerol glycerophosphotransferase family protein [Niallia sp. SS-2023]MDL0437788.1 CDP-glycerol glycerophosphotransferase family protein [Niallia sp. SS-2023]